MDEREQARGLPPEAQDDLLDRLDQAGRKVVKVTASAAVATTLVGALAEPPHAELMSLPEPTPLVQVYQTVDDDPIPDDEDDENDERANRLERVLKVLKLLLVTLALVGTIVFGALKGCAGLLAAPLLPHDDKQEEQTTHQTQTEDERGVAVAG